MVDVAANTTTKAVFEGQTYSGLIEFAGDHDWIKIELSFGLIDFYVSFQQSESVIAGDSFVTLRDAAGNPVADADQGGVGNNSVLKYQVMQSGIYYLDVSEFSSLHTGEYSVVVSIEFGNVDKALTPGHDVYTGLASERILGGFGSDTITLGAAFEAYGEQGNDHLIGNSNSNILVGGLGHDTIEGGDGDDTIYGDTGNDILFGGNNGDDIRGGAGTDFLHGDAGADDLRGGLGKDYLSGGSSADTFFVASRADSPRGGGRDVIMDFFEATDTIDLAAIDAKLGGADNAFKWISTAKFHHRAGELRYVKIDLAGSVNDKTLIQGDMNGDGKADIEIELKGLHNLSAGDFNL